MKLWLQNVAMEPLNVCLVLDFFVMGGGEVRERERDGVIYYEDENYEEFVLKLAK